MEDSIVCTQPGYQEMLVMKYAVMVVIMEDKVDGTTGMLMNVMMEIEDQAMDVMHYVE